MNHNNKMSFLQFTWQKNKGFLLALAISVVVMLLTLAKSYEGYEMEVASKFIGVLAFFVFGITGYKLVQGYRDYLNNTSR